MTKRGRGLNPLVDILVDHRKCIYGVENYICICGADLPSNSHVRLAEHQAEVIEAWMYDVEASAEAELHECLSSLEEECTG